MTHSTPEVGRPFYFTAVAATLCSRSLDNIGEGGYGRPHITFSCSSAERLCLSPCRKPVLGQELKNKPLGATDARRAKHFGAGMRATRTAPALSSIYCFSQATVLDCLGFGYFNELLEFVTYICAVDGNSDKPLEAARYRDGKAWADEVQAVIDAAGSKRPAWSAGPMPEG